MIISSSKVENFEGQTPKRTFKDQDGDIYVKPKSGNGPGDPTGININDLRGTVITDPYQDKSFWEKISDFFSKLFKNKPKKNCQNYMA